MDEPTQVRPGEELDVDRLGEYLGGRLEGIDGTLIVQQFPHGFSNLSYLLRAGTREMVLRRPPFGSPIASAHDMGREYRVLVKLCEVYELAPRALLFCTDETVLGAPFYVMERRQGIVLRRNLPPGIRFDANTARRLCEAFVDNLVRLHRVDYDAAGLAGLGKPEGYVERQISGWIKRYQRARTDDIPAMEEIAGWLVNHLPDSSAATLIHNDYNYDN